MGSGRMSHRGLLYWEIGDSGYPAQQWFHGTPVNIDYSTSPQGCVGRYDIGFYVRESNAESTSASSCKEILKRKPTA
eukprot:UC1_evm1s410